MFTLRLLIVLHASFIMLSMYSAISSGHTVAQLPSKTAEMLSDVSSKSWVSNCYSNHPYLIYASAGAAAFAFLYAFSEGFREKVKSTFGLDVKKCCGCGCVATCGCHIDDDSGCSMEQNKNNESCACCAPRPA